MSNNLPRKPVRFVPQNDELLKSQEGLAGQREGATDFSEDQPYAQISKPSASYRTPIDRVSGNEFFRRYLDGRLDLRDEARNAEIPEQTIKDLPRRLKVAGGSGRGQVDRWIPRKFLGVGRRPPRGPEDRGR